MKRKLVTMILAMTLTASMLVACGDDKAEEKSAPEAKTEEVAEAEEAPAEEAPAEEEAVEEEAAGEETSEEEAAGEETSEDAEASDGSFSLLDVDESMIDVGAYGNDKNGGEIVFTMFTGPDNNKYVSLIGFDNNNQAGDVICGQYEASTEKDEEGDDWTYFDVADVYTGQHFNLGVCERAETEEIVFFDKDGNVVEGQYLSAADTINYMGSAAALLGAE